MDARVKSAHDDKGAVRESPAMLIRALPERALATIVAEERDRLALWLPVLVGAGIGAYFTLTREPPLWLGLVALVAAASIGWLGRRRPGVLVAAMAAAALALGFAATQWRAATVAAPILEKRIGPTSLVARVVSIDRFPAARRVTFDRPRIAGLGPERTPATVRVTFRGHEPPLKPGQWVQARVSLLPPPAPAAPGAFDFQRQAFFQCLGAVGFGLGVPQVTAEGAEEGWDRFTLGLERLRQNITERVLEGLDGERGAIAAAFITGERAAISEELMNAMRDSGLAHLLAVSGMNISLIAGILFVCVRAGLALIPPIALRYPIKKWAAVAAIPGAFAYALIAGATVPTQRAVLMITLVLIGVLIDRQAISMRLCAWAAAAILLTTPETVLGASFQMSFAAVVALVAVYEVFRMRGRFDVDAPRGWARAAAYYLGAVALTTFVASAATTPFAVYHFNRFAVYGLLANMIAVPATSLWVMPWVVPVFVLLPFGLEGWALVPMGWGHRRRQLDGAMGRGPAGRRNRHPVDADGGARRRHFGRPLALSLEAALAPRGRARDRARPRVARIRRAPAHPDRRRGQAARRADGDGRAQPLVGESPPAQPGDLAPARRARRAGARVARRRNQRRRPPRLRRAGLPLPRPRSHGRAGEARGGIARGLPRRRGGGERGAGAQILPGAARRDRPLRSLAERRPRALAVARGRQDRERQRRARSASVGRAAGREGPGRLLSVERRDAGPR